MFRQSMFVILGLMAAVTLGCEKKQETPAAPDAGHVEDHADDAHSTMEEMKEDAKDKAEEMKDAAEDAAADAKDATKDAVNAAAAKTEEAAKEVKDATSN